MVLINTFPKKSRLKAYCNLHTESFNKSYTLSVIYRIALEITILLTLFRILAGVKLQNIAYFEKYTLYRPLLGNIPESLYGSVTLTLLILPFLVGLIVYRKGLGRAWHKYFLL